jgi:hypothetical protein
MLVQNAKQIWATDTGKKSSRKAKEHDILYDLFSIFGHFCLLAGKRIVFKGSCVSQLESLGVC